MDTDKKQMIFTMILQKMLKQNLTFQIINWKARYQNVNKK